VLIASLKERSLQLAGMIPPLPEIFPTVPSDSPAARLSLLLARFCYYRK
jgi:hypothetical protein